MKLLFLLVLIVIIGVTVYRYSSQKVRKAKKKKKFTLSPLLLTTLIVIILLALTAFGMYQSEVSADTQCLSKHTTTSKPSTNLTTAMDYFAEANYEYDTGNCRAAIVDYTTSIQLNPKYPQVYNNRAYTYMRMQDYKDALTDLDRAIALNPNYIQALMNRGDIHNYYYAIDRPRAIADYVRVIALGGKKGTSVCGHLMLARHNGWNVGTVVEYVESFFHSCN